MFLVMDTFTEYSAAHREFVFTYKSLRSNISARLRISMGKDRRSKKEVEYPPESLIDFPSSVRLISFEPTDFIQVVSH